jgi:hypothetical protein
LDLLYAPGSNAECEEPTCCRSDQGAPFNESAAAGYWGDYRDCDTPWHSFVNMLEHIRDTHSVSLQFFSQRLTFQGKMKTVFSLVEYKFIFYFEDCSSS